MWGQKYVCWLLSSQRTRSVIITSCVSASHLLQLQQHNSDKLYDCTEKTHPTRDRNRCVCVCVWMGSRAQVMKRHHSCSITLKTWMFCVSRARGVEDKASGCFDFPEVLTLFQEFLNRLFLTMAQKEKTLKTSSSVVYTHMTFTFCFYGC